MATENRIVAEARLLYNLVPSRGIELDFQASIHFSTVG